MLPEICQLEIVFICLHVQFRLMNFIFTGAYFPFDPLRSPIDGLNAQTGHELQERKNSRLKYNLLTKF